MSESELKRCAELLEIIVRPGDHDFQHAVQEAQVMFGYAHAAPPKPMRKRGRHMRKNRQWLAKHSAL